MFCIHHAAICNLCVCTLAHPYVDLISPISPRASCFLPLAGRAISYLFQLLCGIIAGGGKLSKQQARPDRGGREGGLRLHHGWFTSTEEGRTDADGRTAPSIHHCPSFFHVPSLSFSSVYEAGSSSPFSLAALQPPIWRSWFGRRPRATRGTDMLVAAQHAPILTDSESRCQFVDLVHIKTLNIGVYRVP